MIVQLGENSWRMSSADKDAVLASGYVLDTPLPAPEYQMWVEYEVGYWTLWFL